MVKDQKVSKYYKNDCRYIYIYIEYGVEHNDKNLKFKVGDCVRISKYSNIFEKGYTPKKSEAVFVIKKVKNTEP